MEGQKKANLDLSYHSAKLADFGSSFSRDSNYNSQMNSKQFAASNLQNIQEVKPSKHIVYIEMLGGCENDHPDFKTEQKYEQWFQQIRDQLAPRIRVLKNQMSQGTLINFKNPITAQIEKRIYDRKMGIYQKFPRPFSFEVYFDSYLVYSKLQSKVFPLGGVSSLISKIKHIEQNLSTGRAWNTGLYQSQSQQRSDYTNSMMSRASQISSARKTTTNLILSKNSQLGKNLYVEELRKRQYKKKVQYRSEVETRSTEEQGERAYSQNKVVVSVANQSLSERQNKVNANAKAHLHRSLGQHKSDIISSFPQTLSAKNSKHDPSIVLTSKNGQNEVGSQYGTTEEPKSYKPLNFSQRPLTQATQYHSAEIRRSASKKRPKSTSKTSNLSHNPHLQGSYGHVLQQNVNQIRQIDQNKIATLKSKNQANYKSAFSLSYKRNLDLRQTASVSAIGKAKVNLVKRNLKADQSVKVSTFIKEQNEQAKSFEQIQTDESMVKRLAGRSNHRHDEFRSKKRRQKPISMNRRSDVESKSREGSPTKQPEDDFVITKSYKINLKRDKSQIKKTFSFTNDTSEAKTFSFISSHPGFMDISLPCSASEIKLNSQEQVKLQLVFKVEKQAVQITDQESNQDLTDDEPPVASSMVFVMTQDCEGALVPFKNILLNINYL